MNSDIVGTFSITLGHGHEHFVTLLQYLLHIWHTNFSCMSLLDMHTHVTTPLYTFGRPGKDCVVCSMRTAIGII